MIPTNGCDPKINIISMGADILEHLRYHSDSIERIMFELSKKKNVSHDHIILTLDWLYLINAIEIKNDEVFLREIK